MGLTPSHLLLPQALQHGEPGLMVLFIVGCGPGHGAWHTWHVEVPPAWQALPGFLLRLQQITGHSLDLSKLYMSPLGL